MAGPNLQYRDEQQYVGIRMQATLGEWSRVNALAGEIFGWLKERRMSQRRCE
jgi:hypothetical protein